MHTQRSTNLGPRLLGHICSSCYMGEHLTPILIVAKVHGLKSKSIEFVLAFPQAALDVPVYMELPTGVNPTNVSDGDCHRFILKLNKSLYGLKQAGYNWFEKFRKGLITRNFIQSHITNLDMDCIKLEIATFKFGDQISKR